MIASAKSRVEAGLYSLPPGIKRQVLYSWFHARPGRLRHPQTFSEKVNWRMLHDRRALLAWTCDKADMKVEAARQGVKVPRTRWFGSDVRELPGIALPDAWVLKPNHRSGMVHFGHGQVDLEQVPALEMLAARWTADTRSIAKGEWAYSQVRPGLLIEDMLGSGGSAPPDYKFLVFDGVPAIIEVDTDRFTGHRRRLYTPTWEPLPHENMYPLAPVMPAPARLAEMVAVAARLGSWFDFIRVDLYEVDGVVYFGELTPYPDGGLARFQPRDLDKHLGGLWRLPNL